MDKSAYHKWSKYPLSIFVASIIFLISTTGYPETNQRKALVIGNSDYKYSPLKNPVNDAQDIAMVLKECNFNVIVKTNTNRIEFLKAIREFGDALGKGDIGLFYFAGHGIQVDGVNFLMPVDVNTLYEDEMADYCVKASAVLRKMESSGNLLNLIILDACRNNPFGRNVRSYNRGLAVMDTPVGSLLAYSTAPDSMAIDGSGRNGLYTSVLLKYIPTPNLPVERLFKIVRREVMRASGGVQIPWESSSLMVDFSFIETDTETTVSTPELTIEELNKLYKDQDKNEQKDSKPTILNPTF